MGLESEEKVYKDDRVLNRIVVKSIVNTNLDIKVKPVRFEENDGDVILHTKPFYNLAQARRYKNKIHNISVFELASKGEELVNETTEIVNHYVRIERLVNKIDRKYKDNRGGYKQAM